MQAVQPIALDRDAENAILKTMKRSHYRVIKRELISGVSSLYKVGGATVVLRPEGSELVVVSLAGQGLLNAAVHLANFGRKNGFSTARFHTQRADMGRLKSVLPFISTTQVSKREFIHKVKLL